MASSNCGTPQPVPVTVVDGNTEILRCPSTLTVTEFIELLEYARTLCCPSTEEVVVDPPVEGS